MSRYQGEKKVSLDKMKGGDDWTKEGIDCNKESINTKQALNMK